VCKTQNQNLVLNLLNLTTTLNKLHLSLVIQNELKYNNVRIQTKNIETTTSTPCTMKNYINTKKLAKHKYTMFWNFKSSNRNLRSQNLNFILNSQISLNMFILKLVHN